MNAATLLSSGIQGFSGRQERTVRLATMGTQDHRVVLNDGTNQITLTFQDRDTADNMVWRVVKSCGFRECE